MPASSKIILFIFLLVFSVLYQYNTTATDTTSVSHGFPLPFYTKSICGDPCITAEDTAGGISVKTTENYSYINFAVNAILLYLLSATLVHLYQKK